MKYINSHPEVFYKKVFLKVSQNSQENSCAGVSFSCNFNKKDALAQKISCEFSKIGLRSKYKGKCVQMLPKKVDESIYMFCEYIN